MFSRINHYARRIYQKFEVSILIIIILIATAITSTFE